MGAIAAGAVSSLREQAASIDPMASGWCRMVWFDGDVVDASLRVLDEFATVVAEFVVDRVFAVLPDCADGDGCGCRLR